MPMDLKIRIFALAKELGMDSKVLIEHCNAAGIKLKNSPLASISPEERDLVLGFIKKGGPSVPAVEEPQSTPAREPVPREVSGKIRSIKAAVSRPPLAHDRATAVLTPEADVEAETVLPDGTVPPNGRDIQDTDIQDIESGAHPAAAEEAALEPSAAEPAPIPSGVSPAPLRGQLRRTGGTNTGAPENVVEAPVSPMSPLRPEEYVPPGGVRNASSIREMKPRGTIIESEQAQARRPKPKSKPALPNVAAPPNYRPPVIRSTTKEESPAQKPDIPLSPDVFSANSPLRAHLKKNAEQKKKRKKGEGEEPIQPLGPGSFVSEEGDRDRKATGTVRDRRENWRVATQKGEEGSDRKRRPVRFRQRRGGGEPISLKTAAEVSSPMTIRSLSEAMGRPAKDLLKVLFERGEMATINQVVADEVALELAMEFGVDLAIRKQKNIEQEVGEALEAEETNGELVNRPPIVTILGHVDHGKTTLLDKIRSANVAAGEAGGITQHIAAYQVEHKAQRITFVDTPGHAAFSEMRARGANLTDIVVLVVAADDGVMPQTVECISHARAANVPIVVAMNKIDLPNRNEQRVLQELASNNVIPAEWGGDTEVIRTSAATGQGIDELLETLLVSAELRELKANPNRPAVGVCLEAFRDEGRGVLAWFVIQKGTLRVGDVIVCGEAFGRIRAIYDDLDRTLTEAGPSTPVKIAGLDVMPGAGDQFWVMADIEQAREVADQRRDRGRAANLTGRSRPRSMEDILAAAREGTVQDLPLIIKADTQGSIEALRSEIEKFSHPEVRVTIVHEGVGGVNESDVALAEASGAIVIAFHVVPEERARALAERVGVDVRRFEIIYEVTETIKRSLEGLLLPERKQVMTGRAVVLRIFQISRIGTIAGCRVLNGTIERSNRINVIREQTILNSYDIASLKRGKDDAREARDGMECGIRLEGFNDVKEGDILEAFRVDEIKRTLD
jgi:translation initiation factor IF-2